MVTYFFPSCKATAQFKQASKAAMRLGMVYYGTTAYYGYPLLEAFAKRHPGVRVSTITAQSAQVYKHLHHGAIDAALTIISADYGDAVTRARVATLPLHAFMQTDHPLVGTTRDAITMIAEGPEMMKLTPFTWSGNSL